MRWALIGAALIAAVLLVHLRLTLDRADRRIGVTYNPTAPEVRLVEVDEDGPAARAGLREGDLLLALDGQPIHEPSDFDRLATQLARGRAVEVEAAREDRRLRFQIVPGMPMDVGGFALSAIACALYLALGLLASARRADDLRASLLVAFCLAVAFELALPTSVTTTDTAIGLATQLGFVLVTGLQFGLDLHLATVLPTPPAWLERRRWVVRGFYGIGLSLAGFTAVATVFDALGGAWASPLAELGNELINSWLLPVWAVAVGSIIARRALTYPDPRGRLQAGLVLLGVLPWVAVVLWDTVVTAFELDSFGLSTAIWNYALLAYPLAVFVAIFLYRLFDLELVVRRSLLYGGLTTLLVVGFYALVGGIGALFARQFGEAGVPLWVQLTAGLSMGLLFNPLRTRLNREIDQRLFPERLALRSRLVGLAAELPAQGKLPRMGEHLAHELAKIFGVAPVTVWIATPPQGQLVELASSETDEPDFEQTALVGADDPAIELLTLTGRPLPLAQLAAASPGLAHRLRAARAELSPRCSPRSG